MTTQTIEPRRGAAGDAVTGRRAALAHLDPRTGPLRAALADLAAPDPLTGPLPAPIVVDRAHVYPADEAEFWALLHERGASWLGVAPPPQPRPVPVEVVTRSGQVIRPAVGSVATSGRPWTPPPARRPDRTKRVGALRSLATAACLIVAMAVSFR